MQYKFTRDRENYEMYASGGVIYAAPGHTAFPVRLANEVFRRCLAFRAAQGMTGPCTLYDPCCGGAYHLTTLAYFNLNSIARIIGSDIDEDAVALARRNLSLLHSAGLERRIEELAALHERFGKPSHAAALDNARILRQWLEQWSTQRRIETAVFRADATDRRSLKAGLAGVRPDVVFTDIPYGWRSNWSPDTLALEAGIDPVQALLDAQGFLQVDLHVGHLTACATGRLVDHHGRLRQQVPLALSTAREQESCGRRLHTDTYRHHVVRDVLHGVVNRHGVVYAAARAVNVEEDVFLRILSLQEQKLRNDQVGGMRVYFGPQKDNAVLKQTAIYVVRALNAPVGFDNCWYKNAVLWRCHIFKHTGLALEMQEC